MNVALTENVMLPRGPAGCFSSAPGGAGGGGLPCDLSQLPKSQPLFLYLGNGPWDRMIQTYKESVEMDKGRSGHT